MNEHTKALPHEEAAIGLSMNVQLDKAGQRTIVFQTHVPQSSTDAEINRLLDLAHRTTDRQASMFLVREVEEQLEEFEKNLAWAKVDYLAVETRSRAEWERGGKKGAWKPLGKEQTDQQNAAANIKRGEDAIAHCHKKLARLRSIIDGPHSSADSGEGAGDSQDAGSDAAGG